MSNEDLSMEWDAFWAGLALAAIVCFLAVSVYMGGFNRSVMPAEREWSEAQEVLSGRP